MWDEIGKLQFEFMLTHGLLPQHRLLDVGCGSLRGGVHFVRYLEKGNYYGVDQDQWLLDAGLRHELKDEGLADRQPLLLCRDDFDFSAFGTTFDFAIAQSVFTHLPWNSILRCLYNAQQVLKPGGRFFATFFEDPKEEYSTGHIHHSPGEIVTYPDKDPYHYSFSVFRDLADRARLNVNYIGEWDHPRAQRMLEFSK